MKCTLAVVAALSLVALTGCGSADSTAPAASSAAPAAQTLTVFAAASLKTTFTELGQDFEATHPGITVSFSFAGSADLVTQLQAGAPADVFASADTTNMDKVIADGLARGAPVDFASNTLTIATPPDNPASISSFADLARAGVKVVVCAPAVPCGAAAAKVETATGVTLTPVSEEQSVTDVLNKVATGEADAGLVYVTDVTSAGDEVLGVPFPESSAAVNRYPLVGLAASTKADLAQEFVELVTGARGRQVLEAAGFAKP